ncbi:MAG: hypothetical protein OXC94_07040 [Chloroflexi bacterium]|nr:hypothetical protein [Chloroflexota bacterium]
MYDDALAWILSLALLGAIMLLASVALRAGESAGHQPIERPDGSSTGGGEPGRSRRFSLPLGRLAARLRRRSH